MPISMTPEEYYEAFTLGNYEDFKENPRCVRRAFNAAIAASHLADHYFNYYKKQGSPRVSMYGSIGNYVEYISGNTKGYFRDIRSIANAYKHLYTGINKSHAKHSSISSAGTIERAQFIDEEIEQVSDGPTEDNTSEYVVGYTKKSGEKLEFMPTLKAVIDFWQGELFR